MKILKILIFCTLLIFPFGELLRLDLGNNIVLKPLDMIAGLILLFWSILVVTKRIKKPEFSWYYILFPLVGLLSLVINSTWLKPHELLASAMYLIRWVSYLGVFFAVKQMDKNFKQRVISLLLIDGLVIVLLGYVQYFFFSSLKPLYYLGWDDHMYRLFSVFLDPNYTGGLLVLYLLFTGGLFYIYFKDSKAKSSKVVLYKNFALSKKKIMILLSSVMILTLIALFLTFSRSALLMLIVGASVFFILIGRKKLILLLFATLLVFILLISSKFNVESINLFRHASSVARIGNYEVALSIFQEHPFLGVGFNTYRYAKDFYHIQSDWTKAPSHADAGVDNSFLFVLVTTGVVGLTMYLFVWFYIFKRAFQLYKNEKNIHAAVVIASCLGLFVHALFINSLFFPAIMFWIWILAALMEKKSL
jgi:putative inorganic carbon (HCO3(-)) transporter